jgi:hypothetical protein
MTVGGSPPWHQQRFVLHHTRSTGDLHHNLQDSNILLGLGLKNWTKSVFYGLHLQPEVPIPRTYHSSNVPEDPWPRLIILGLRYGLPNTFLVTDIDVAIQNRAECKVLQTSDPWCWTTHKCSTKTGPYKGALTPTELSKKHSWIGNFTQFLEFFGPLMKVTFYPRVGAPKQRDSMFSHEGAYLPRWRTWLRAHKRFVSSLGKAMSPLLLSRGSYSRPPKLKGPTPQSEGIPLPNLFVTDKLQLTIFNQMTVSVKV